MSSSTTSVKLEAGLRDRLQKLAERRHSTPHKLMQLAIEDYVSREEHKDALRSEALEAWRDYQLTGFHVSAGEADAWLGRLEAGEEAAAPIPHP
jgi:predicted transcriptional regulator